MAKEQEKLEQHPLAKLFPSPDSGTLDALKKRIFHGGKLNPPVVLFEGKVIEHWPEYGACVEFSLPFTTTEYRGTEDELVEHLLQTNTLQLGKVHRALIGAYLKKLYREKSKACGKFLREPNILFCIHITLMLFLWIELPLFCWKDYR